MTDDRTADEGLDVSDTIVNAIIAAIQSQRDLDRNIWIDGDEPDWCGIDGRINLYHVADCVMGSILGAIDQHLDQQTRH